MSSGLKVVDPSTPPSLDALEPDERVRAMVDWFTENFEDPAHQTPYESAEGGYIWIWGGPYDANDQLQGYFPDASMEEVEAAVGEIEAEGIVDWAPAGNRIRPEYDEEDDIEPPPVPLEERLKALRQQLNDVEEGIKRLPARPPLMGHNRPPEEFRDYLSEEEKAGALQSIGEVRKELDKPDPAVSADADTIQRAEGRLRGLAIKLWGWIKGLGMTAATAAAGEAGRELVQDPTALVGKIEIVVSTLATWGHILGALF